MPTMGSAQGFADATSAEVVRMNTDTETRVVVESALSTPCQHSWIPRPGTLFSRFGSRVCDTGSSSKLESKPHMRHGESTGPDALLLSLSSASLSVPPSVQFSSRWRVSVIVARCARVVCCGETICMYGFTASLFFFWQGPK